jgi:hypothetical protein
MNIIKSINYKSPQIIELEKLIFLIGFNSAPNLFSISFNDEPILMSDSTQYSYFFNRWRIIIEYKHHDVHSNKITFELAGLHRDDVYDVTEHLFFGRCNEDDIKYYNDKVNLFRDNCKEILYLEFKSEIRKNKITKLLGQGSN